ncbi:MAG TPA: type III-B CRISPR module-associated Cmr3 family protein [Thermoanaerobaculia bacterium]
MNVWLIEPIDPLIARDGRPAAVGRFDTVRFPFPSMVAGAVRTRMGSPGGAFLVPRGALEELKEKIPVQGPLLAELDAETGDVYQWLAPAPRDAAYVQEEGETVTIRRLLPRPFEPGEAMDSFAEKGLLPVQGGMAPLSVLQELGGGAPLPADGGAMGEGTGVRSSGGALTAKPPEKLPSFWSWSHYESWLTAPADSSGESPFTRGIAALPVEKRAHLAIRPDERVGMDGMLFQTAGLRFLQPGDGDHALTPRRFALSLRCQDATAAGRALALAPQIAPLGGERRLARWSPAADAWPRLPAAVRNSIVTRRRARLLLLTPAIFEHGTLPGWSGNPWPGSGAVRATVLAACVGRPEVVSGWDLAQGEAKHTRRMAAAGSVYFVALDGGDEADLRAWCDQTWLACVSDDPAERRDGFGLAALGTWEDAR